MGTTLVLLNRCLRLDDNPLLHRALAGSERLLICWCDPVLDQRGGASKVWLHSALHDFDARLRSRGQRLLVAGEAPMEHLLNLARSTGAERLILEASAHPLEADWCRQFTGAVENAGIAVEQVDPAFWLHWPGSLRTGSGSAYKVFTAFWRTFVRDVQPASPLDAPAEFPPLPSGCDLESRATGIEQLGLLPSLNWHAKFANHWTPTEAAGLERLNGFVQGGLESYERNRDLPGIDGTSRLSPWLAMGQISPRRIWQQVWSHLEANDWLGEGAWAFLRELGWREFAWHVLSCFPASLDSPLDRRFDHFAWREDDELLERWQRGATGIPLVDAGMRELWQTGYMHNRVRMISASLLVKNGLIDWRRGRDWFADTLVDADPANNLMGWQWVAGCGVDAAPYFRIFNPVRQGERFDPDGCYVRQWVPEAGSVPVRRVHAPWLLPGWDGAMPVLDLQQTRKRALAAFDQIKSRPAGS